MDHPLYSDRRRGSEPIVGFPKEESYRHSWKGIIGMRNVLVHQYFGLDLDEIWDTVSVDLPVLKVRIQELLTEKRIDP